MVRRGGLELGHLLQFYGAAQNSLFREMLIILQAADDERQSDYPKHHRRLPTFFLWSNHPPRRIELRTI